MSNTPQSINDLRRKVLGGVKEPEQTNVPPQDNAEDVDQLMSQKNQDRLALASEKSKQAASVAKQKAQEGFGKIKNVLDQVKSKTDSGAPVQETKNTPKAPVPINDPVPVAPEAEPVTAPKVEAFEPERVAPPVIKDDHDEKMKAFMRMKVEEERARLDVVKADVNLTRARLGGSNEFGDNHDDETRVSFPIPRKRILSIVFLALLGGAGLVGVSWWKARPQPNPEAPSAKPTATAPVAPTHETAPVVAETIVEPEGETESLVYDTYQTEVIEQYQPVAADDQPARARTIATLQHEARGATGPAMEEEDAEVEYVDDEEEVVVLPPQPIQRQAPRQPVQQERDWRDKASDDIDRFLESQN